MIRRFLPLAVALCIELSAAMHGAAATAHAHHSAVWLSDEKPARGVSKRPEGMSHGGQRGPRTLTLWPLTEESNGTLRCLSRADGAVRAYGPAMQPLDASISVKRGCASIGFAAEQPGIYTLYYTAQSVHNATLLEETAKFEKYVGRHGEHADTLQKAATPADTPLLDIMRVKAEDEGHFRRFHSGDVLTFRVLFKENPAAGAEVALKTGEGWSKRLRVGSDGLASFRLIKSYFPEWSAFDKRHKEHFVVTASYLRGMPGESEGTHYEKTRYRTTYPGVFYPESSAYRSYAFALAIGTAALLLSGLFVYLYRRRRHTPFKEVIFDEKD